MRGEIDRVANDRVALDRLARDWVIEPIDGDATRHEYRLVSLFMTWDAFVAMLGLNNTATAEEAAASAGLVIAPGSTEKVELRGDVLCYPENIAEPFLRTIVISAVRGSGTFRVATSQRHTCRYT